MWRIKDIEIKTKVILAPMAGVSTPAFMKICEYMGAGYVITELISSEAIVRNNKKTFDMLKGLEDLNIPYAIQIFGSDSNIMAKAAQIIHGICPMAMIDINLGCPVPKVAIRSGAGSALMKDPNKIYEIVSAVVKSVPVAVTVKIRSGWDEEHINAVEVAKICEKAGASAITIHGRTRSQGYSGRSDLNIIKSVVDAVNIPVIGNGDITNPELAKKMLDETGCIAVMVGRGVLGNPWLIKEINEYLETGHVTTNVNAKEKLKILKEHYRLMCKYMSEKQSVLEIRSNALWYLKGLPNNNVIKNKICASKTSNEIFNILDEYYTGL